MTAPDIALALGIAAVLLMPAAGLGYRSGLLPLSMALSLGMGAAALLGLAAIATTIVAMRSYLPTRGIVINALALALGLVALVIPLLWLRAAATVPSIHDITTDVANPPSFDAVVARRSDAVNTLDYDPSVGRLQQAGYPDLGPIVLAEPPGPVFERALRAARAAGWEMVSVDATAGRIEATDTTFWFGFKDDIVIRLTPQDGATRVDVRSVSRLGRSDVGTNARRIRAYLASLQAG